MTILFIDDDLGMHELMCLLFESEGFRVVCATNGREALDRVACDPPDFIFLDHNMDVMGGQEFMIELARLYPEVSRDVPIVMLTGHEPSKLQDVRGPKEILRKPLCISNLVSLVKKYTEVPDGIQRSLRLDKNPRHEIR